MFFQTYFGQSSDRSLSLELVFIRHLSIFGQCCASLFLHELGMDGPCCSANLFPQELISALSCDIIPWRSPSGCLFYIEYKMSIKCSKYWNIENVKRIAFDLVS